MSPLPRSNAVVRPIVSIFTMRNGRRQDKEEVIMQVVTTESIAHYRIVETKGQVFGVVVRSRGLGGNIMAGLRSLAGGEIIEYTKLVEESRPPAIRRIGPNTTT